MSISKRTPLEEAALEYPCIQCQADPGMWCRTISTKVASQLHEPRWLPLANYAKHEVEFARDMTEAGARYEDPGE